MKKTLAVKDIAQFLYSSGDLTNEFFSNHTNHDGTKAHKFLQNKYNDESEKEYYVKITEKIDDDEITVHGFIDGLLKEDGKTIIEEIKSTEEDLKNIDLNYHLEYLSQLKLYGYIYSCLEEIDVLNLRLTYITLDEYKTKSFDLVFDKETLKEFFYTSLKQYLNWIHLLDESANKRLSSIDNVEFPFKEKRKGQMEMMKGTYFALSQNFILYTIAPTGIGKTMATLFSALKTMKKKNEKLFYLTAKTMGKEVVVESIKMLLKKGLSLHSIVLSSKAKSCLFKQEHCDPLECPFAKGYFSKLRQAIEDIYQNENLYTFDILKEYALKYNICQFEFSLDLSYFCDLIVCDYNYVFDPKAHLIRYFEETEYEPKILCDEAHNLVERSKDMYSSNLSSLIPYVAEEIAYSFDKNISKLISKFKHELKKYNELLNEELFFYSKEIDEQIIDVLKKLATKLEVVITDNKKKIEDKNRLLDAYFKIKDFTDTADFFSESHLFVVKKNEDESFELIIKCCDASDFILETVKRKTKGIVFFSATLYPIKYYMDLLTKGEGKYLVLNSPFDKDNLKIIVKDDISTKYKDRQNTVDDIIKTIEALVYAKKGNYITFFPSYKYLELVQNKLDIEGYEIIVQDSKMTDLDREKVFNKFKNTKTNHLGLFVLGGSFSEGVDFVGDLLNGVIIVGVGLPQISIENNLLKEYFDQKYDDGFDYAYTYPGFNKVIQAAGRVIRTATDRGAVILLDSRYKNIKYKSLMPEYWSERITMNGTKMIKSNLEIFFNEDKDIIV